MGVGVYLVWPAFYTDVTDAYRLDRRGRLRTDLGGVYFNAIFALLAGAALLRDAARRRCCSLVFVQHVIVLQQLLPLLRFDGYYVLSDLTGVPDMLVAHQADLPLAAARRGGREPARGGAEAVGARASSTGYMIVLVPELLLFMIVSMVMHAPRMFATAYDSLGLQLDRLQTGGRGGRGGARRLPDRRARDAGRRRCR